MRASSSWMGGGMLSSMLTGMNADVRVETGVDMVSDGTTSVGTAAQCDAAIALCSHELGSRFIMASMSAFCCSDRARSCSISCRWAWIMLSRSCSCCSACKAVKSALPVMRWATDRLLEVRVAFDACGALHVQQLLQRLDLRNDSRDLLLVGHSAEDRLDIEREMAAEVRVKPVLVQHNLRHALLDELEVLRAGAV